MKKRNFYIVLMTAVLLTASCSRQDDLPVIDEHSLRPITFAATTGDISTRATGMMNETMLKEKGFGVFASYTGMHRYSESNVSANFMWNERLSYDASGHWTYEPLRYWPNGEGNITGEGTPVTPHYVSFFAYAPYNAYDEHTRYCIHSTSRAEEQGDPWIIYRLNTQDNLDHQVDLLYADPMLDQTKQTVDGSVGFTFRHALACVGDKVTITISDALQSIASTSSVKLTDLTITYTLTEKARLVLWNNGEANWQPILSENHTTTRTITLLSGGSVTLYDGTNITPFTISNKGLFYIPVEIDGYRQQAAISLAYQIGDGTPVSKTQTLRLSDYPEAFKAGRKLDINIKVE